MLFTKACSFPKSLVDATTLLDGRAALLPVYFFRLKIKLISEVLTLGCSPVTYSLFPKFG